MDMILVPGFWLDGDSWAEVTGPLEAAGHCTHALALPGKESADADRSGIRQRDHVRARAVPEPAAVARDLQELHDPARYEVPVTVIACEIDAATMREWITQGHPYVSELARIRDREIVDLPTGHWPQLTRRVDLAATIITALQTSQPAGEVAP